MKQISSSIPGLLLRGLVLVLVCASLAFSQNYTFRKVAELARDTSSISWTFSGTPTINDNGDVAFVVTEVPDAKTVNQTLFRVDAQGGGRTKIADTSGPLQYFRPAAIDNKGTVLFLAGRDDGSVGIYTGSGGNLKQIVTSAENSELAFDLTGFVDSAPSMNNREQITYRTGFLSRKLFLYQDGASQLIAEKPQYISPGALNDSGQVAYVFEDGTLLNGGLFLYDLSAQQVTPIESDAGPLYMSATSAPDINDAGDIVFVAYDDPTQQEAIYVHTASGTQKIVASADTTDLVLNGESGFDIPPQRMSINNDGTIVFWGTALKEGVFASGGIYTGPDPDKDRVIGSGDRLFGSYFVSSSAPIFGGDGRVINNRGEIVFYYSLDNLEAGIAIATPSAQLTSAPSISENSILNSASYALSGQPDSAPAPGSIVSIFGENFSTDREVAPGSPLPTSLNGVEVTVNGIPAPIFFVSPTQINVQMPSALSGTSAEVRVTTALGESLPQSVSIAPTSPSVFTFDLTGHGQGIVVFANTATLVAPSGLTADSRPASGGDVLTIYANGLGAVNPPVDDGLNSCNPDGVCAADYSNLVLRNVVSKPSLEVGGIAVPDENISFAGLVPAFVGLYQINFTLPPGVPVGNTVPIILRQSDTSSRADVTIAIH